MNSKIKFSREVAPGDVVAIGDVHARYDLFSQMVEWLRGSGARVVMLGDLIDRGGQDLEVLDLAKSLMDDPESYGLEAFYCLKGNHEQMFVDAAFSYGFQEEILWVQNGGNFHCLEEMVERHVGWLKELPVFMQIGNTLFVHAGLVPAEDPKVTIKKGNSDQLVWIRGPFLKKGAKLHKWTDSIKQVVHGHSITSKLPTMFSDRVNLDTGAFMTGVLTAYNVTQGTFHQVTGEPNAAYGTI
jgi:serine/threonine protein phosphatase 1